MNKVVTVVVIRSLSYTGTTWFNTVLGSHQRAFALGPPDRVYEMRKERTAECCRVHGEDCPFWTSFWDRYDPAGNFFLQLAEHADRDVIVINNPVPTGAGTELQHPGIVVKPLYLIRDGRALASSYRRHTEDASYLDAVTDFLWPSFDHFYFDPNNTDKLCLRYEDVMADAKSALHQVGKYVGLDYDEQALRFWEFEHHLAAGNAGTLALIKIGEGLPLSNFQRREFYENQFKEMQDKGPAAFVDDAWKEELTVRERFVFDVLWGATNEAFGYDRDRFSLNEVATFSDELRAAIEENSLDSEAAKKLAENLETQPASAPIALNEPEFRLPVREQLRWSNLRTRGVNLTPRQLRLLAVKVVFPSMLMVCVLLGAAFLVI